jgi:cytochrome c-type biogenesis protein CcmH
VSAFPFLAALLAVVALAFVLPPLLRRRGGLSAEERDEANATLYRNELVELERDLAAGTVSEAAYRDARLELERRLLEDVADSPGDRGSLPAQAAPRSLAVTVGVLVPVIALSGYLAIGNPRALDPVARTAPESSHTATPEQFAAMVEKLAARMETKPDDAEGWAMLARSYAVLGQFDKALPAYERVTKLSPDNPGLLADYADTLAQARGRTLAGEPHALVKRALELDPKHLKALALAGSAEFEARNFAGAVAYWERILPLAQDNADFTRSVVASIDEARQLGRLPSAPAVSAAPAAAAAPGKAISGTVTIAPALAKQVSPGDTLFVFARPADGSRMPLAILRATAGELPYRFTLDDTHAMSPNARLSGQSSVVIAARISKSGGATPQPGDLQGASQPLAPGVTGLEIVIDSAVK